MSTPNVGLWRVEHRLIEELIRRVERAERALLQRLGCPTDLPAVYAILSGEREHTWSKRTAARDKARARHAMHALAHLAAARRYVGLGSENARLAAHEALLAGLYANDAAANAALAARVGAGSRRGAKARGEEIRAAASADTAEMRRLEQQFIESRGTRRGAASYIARRLSIPVYTVRRKLKKQ